jgi:hypothetical protein
MLERTPTDFFPVNCFALLTFYNKEKKEENITF